MGLPTNHPLDIFGIFHEINQLGYHHDLGTPHMKHPFFLGNHPLTKVGKLLILDAEDRLVSMVTRSYLKKVRDFPEMLGSSKDSITFLGCFLFFSLRVFLFVGKDARELCWFPHFDAWKTSLSSDVRWCWQARIKKPWLIDWCTQQKNEVLIKIIPTYQWIIV